MYFIKTSNNMLVNKISSTLFLIWSSLVFISAMVLVLPFILICSSFFKGKQRQDMIFFFLKIWGWVFCTLCFFQVKVQNKHLINPKKAYIYVCNHNSYLDAIAIVIAIPGSFKPLGKIEMVKMPIFGLVYQRVVVMIDRKSKESRARSIEALKADLSKGQSILIFPEGTMNRTENALTEFYDGAFRLALETQIPIAPMVILNTKNLFPRSNSLAAKPGMIKCIFDQPVEVNGMTANDLQALKFKIYGRMEKLIVNS
jgi:1-acyl-sn-glycerol-3-phosphate acyltransferase